MSRNEPESERQKLESTPRGIGVGGTGLNPRRQTLCRNIEHNSVAGGRDLPIDSAWYTTPVALNGTNFKKEPSGSQI
jgi:hypothetical protein